MELYLIRHAQSTNNALADAAYRVCDPPLTAIGLQQAELLAVHLAEGAPPHEPWRRGYGLQRLYTSPMARALATTRAITQRLGLRPEVWVDLHEQGGIYLDQGLPGGAVGLPGKTRAEMLEICSSLAIPEAVTERGWWHSGYEEVPEFLQRAARVAGTLRQWAGRDERVALVSHGGLADALLCALLGRGHGLGFYDMHNTGISLLEITPCGVELRFADAVEHLPAGLLT